MKIQNMADGVQNKTMSWLVFHIITIFDGYFIFIFKRYILVDTKKHNVNFHNGII